MTHHERKIRDVMTPNPQSIQPSTTVQEAAKLMRDQDVGPIPIVENGSVTGIVTDRDIVIRAIAEGADPKTTQLGQVVSGELHAVAPEDPVERAIAVMREKAIRRVPVLEGDKLVGVLSIGDLAIERDADSALADIASEPPNN
jgi:CBS domain-containing protein